MSGYQILNCQIWQLKCQKWQSWEKWQWLMIYATLTIVDTSEVRRGIARVFNDYVSSRERANSVFLCLMTNWSEMKNLKK